MPGAACRRIQHFGQCLKIISRIRSFVLDCYCEYPVPGLICVKRISGQGRDGVEFPKLVSSDYGNSAGNQGRKAFGNLREKMNCSEVI
jgi:hypothetical protein